MPGPSGATVRGVEVKLYRSKIPQIAAETLDTLIKDGDIDVSFEKLEEARKDLAAIMEEYLRRDNDFRNRVRDHMAATNIPYDQYGKARSRIAEEWQHPLNDEVERFLARQFVENMMISQFIEEVFADDKDLYRKVIEVLKRHNVDEAQIREEAIGRIKNVREGTVEYEIALQNAIKEIKKRQGLM